ncbi:MAG: HEAT repeat domain-containing protein [Planctomycetes bacterium]|nr:HEAT repeat domain-containing protein [Planctomycetota bacterium]
MLNRLYRIFACGVFFGLLFTPVAGEALYGNDLDTLTEKYRQVRSSAGKPGTSAWPGAVERKVAPILARIGKLKDPEALKMLRREYSGTDAYLVAAAGLAMIEGSNKEGLEAAIKGFGKGSGWKTYSKVRVLDAIAATGKPAARDFVIKAATSGTSEMRVIAIGSLSNFPRNQEACEALIDGLKSSHSMVRNASLQALHKFKVKEMVPALIARLGKEKDSARQSDVLNLLVKRTGVNMGLVARDWNKWWKETGDRFEFPKASAAGAPKANTVVVPTYFGLEVASKRVIFLVDASISMLQSATGPKKKGRKKNLKGAPGTKMAALKKELTSILKKLPDTTMVNIIFFNVGPIPWKSSLQPLRGRGRQEAIAFVNNLDCKLKTNIYDSLVLALKDRRADTLFLLSDGKPIGGTFTKPADILREIGAKNRVRGAKINCISFGQETPFLKQLAKQNGGVYRATSGGGGGKKAGKGKNAK